MEWLLGKKEIKKVALVSYFYETNQTKMLIPDLERHFNWSTYMIKSLINELLHDQKRFGVPEQGQLRLSPSEREVELIPGNRAYLLSLTASYIKESYALMLDLRTDFSLPCKLIVEEHFLYDSIFTRI